MIAAVGGVILLAGCVAPRPAELPMPTGVAPGREAIDTALEERPREVKKSFTGEVWRMGSGSGWRECWTTTGRGISG